MSLDKYSFTTQRLSLKVMTLDDLEGLYKVLSLDAVGKWLSTGKGKTLKETEAKIIEYRQGWEKYGYGVWGIFHKDRLIGQAGLNNIGNDEVEVLYALIPDSWGYGYASEVACFCLEYGFVDVGLETIYALCRVDNLASKNVMSKRGFTYLEDRSFKGMEVSKYKLDKKDWLNER